MGIAGIWVYWLAIFSGVLAFLAAAAGIVWLIWSYSQIEKAYKKDEAGDAVTTNREYERPGEIRWLVFCFRSPLDRGESPMYNTFGRRLQRRSVFMKQE